MHTIPGLDTVDADKASLRQELAAGQERIAIKVLSPVSMVCAKLHALRHFEQAARNDLEHLRVCLQAAKMFISELVQAGEVRSALWNCERLLTLHGLKATLRLEREHGFQVLSAIPIESIRRAADETTGIEKDRQRLAGFVARRWARVAEGKAAQADADQVVTKPERPIG